MKQISAIIFDMDGVLADSQKLHVLAEMEACAHFGITTTEDWMIEEAGKPDSQTFMELLIENGKDPNLTDQMMEYKYGKVMPKIMEEKGMPPIEGAKEVVEYATKNFKCAVASSATRDFINFLLGKMGFEKMLNVIVSNDDVPPGRGKPHPDIFLLAAEKLGVDPENCLVIEDASHGVHAAKAAGMMCIGFKNPGSGEQDLEAADWVVGRMEEINQILLSSE